MTATELAVSLTVRRTFSPVTTTLPSVVTSRISARRPWASASSAGAERTAARARAVLVSLPGAPLLREAQPSLICFLSDKDCLRSVFGISYSSLRQAWAAAPRGSLDSFERALADVAFQAIIQE